MDLVKLKADPRVWLRVYLNDHLAGAMGGIRLAERCRGNNAGTELGSFLDVFLTELHQDYDTLRRLVSDLGLPVARPKQLAAIAAEWVGRAKLNGQLLGYSPLGRLVELEALCVGVEGKRNLWRSLVEIQDANPTVASLDLEELIRRAEDQRRGLEEHRRSAAAEALAGGG